MVTFISVAFVSVGFIALLLCYKVYRDNKKFWEELDRTTRTNTIKDLSVYTKYLMEWEETHDFIESIPTKGGKK